MVLDASLLKTQHYKVRIKGKVKQSRERSSDPSPRWSSYSKGSLRVTLDYGHQLYLLIYQCIGPVVRVFAKDPRNRGSIQTKKTKKMVLNTYLLNTQLYKLRIKGQVEIFREWSSAFPYTSVSYLMKMEPSVRLWLCLSTSQNIYKRPNSKSCLRRKWTKRPEFKTSTGLLHFSIALISLRNAWIPLFSLQLSNK